MAQRITRKSLRRILSRDRMDDAVTLPKMQRTAEMGELQAMRGRKLSDNSLACCNDFCSETKLGAGAGGTVYTVKHHPDLAMKLLINAETDKENEEAFDNELKMLQLLQSKQLGTIVPQLVCFNRAERAIVTNRLYGVKPEQWGSVEFQRSVVTAIKALTKSGILHNDLHAGNVMANDAGRAVLIDFDLSSVIKPKDPAIEDQLVLAQLYALIDSCNSNTRMNICLEDEPEDQPGTIASEIYAIRQRARKLAPAMGKVANGVHVLRHQARKMGLGGRSAKKKTLTKKAAKTSSKADVIQTAREYAASLARIGAGGLLGYAAADAASRTSLQRLERQAREAEIARQAESLAAASEAGAHARAEAKLMYWQANSQRIMEEAAQKTRSSSLSQVTQTAAKAKEANDIETIISSTDAAADGLQGSPNAPWYDPSALQKLVSDHPYIAGGAALAVAAAAAAAAAARSRRSRLPSAPSPQRRPQTSSVPSASRPPTPGGYEVDHILSSSTHSSSPRSELSATPPPLSRSPSLTRFMDLNNSPQPHHPINTLIPNAPTAKQQRSASPHPVSDFLQRTGEFATGLYEGHSTPILTHAHARSIDRRIKAAAASRNRVLEKSMMETGTYRSGSRSRSRNSSRRGSRPSSRTTSRAPQTPANPNFYYGGLQPYLATAVGGAGAVGLHHAHPMHHVPVPAPGHIFQPPPTYHANIPKFPHHTHASPPPTLQGSSHTAKAVPTVRALGQALALMSGLAASTGVATGLYQVGKKIGKNIGSLFALLAALGLSGHILPMLHRSVRKSHHLSDIYNDAQAATVTPPAARAPETASQLGSALRGAARSRTSHDKVRQSAMLLWRELSSKYKHTGKAALLSTLLAVLAIILYKKMALARAAHRRGSGANTTSHSRRGTGAPLTQRP